MSEAGVGGLTISEMARRMDLRGPSLYKYFPSLHAVYDELFARALAAQTASVQEVMSSVPRGVDRVRAGAQQVVRWAVANPALAQLLFWRPVPGFEPSAQTMAASRDDMRLLREELAEAVRLGQLDSAATSDEAVRLYTVQLSGILTQQLANQPGTTYEDGDFSRLTDAAIALFLDHYAPGRT